MKNLNIHELIITRFITNLVIFHGSFTEKKLTTNPWENALYELFALVSRICVKNMWTINGYPFPFSSKLLGYVHMHPWKNAINHIAVPFGIIPKMHGSDCCFSKFIFLEAPQTVYNRFLRKCILQIVCNNITDSGKQMCAFSMHIHINFCGKILDVFKHPRKISGK